MTTPIKPLPTPAPGPLPVPLNYKLVRLAKSAIPTVVAHVTVLKSGV